MAGPSPWVSVQPLSTPSPGSCNSRRGPSQGMGLWVLGPAVSSPCKCCFRQELPCKVTSTTMYKATAAAASLPPVQRKLNLFHILINQCEFLIRVQGCFLGMRDFRKEGTRGARLKEGHSNIVTTSCCVVRTVCRCRRDTGRVECAPLGAGEGASVFTQLETPSS